MVSSALLVVAPALAQAPPPAPQLSQSQAGFHRFKLGDVDVTALSDGTLSLDFGPLLHMPKARYQSMLKAAFVKPFVNASVNAYLIRTAGRLILVDAGAGELYGPSLDKLPASLRAVGVEPSQITDILVTHIHTDHTGGLMDGATPVFPNAVIHVERKEVDFWLSDENKAQARDHHKRLFDEAKLKFAPSVAAGKVKPFDGAVELLPGIRSIPSPGHTPGHSFYALESKGEKMVFWGDIMHVAEVQFPQPAITIAFDSDPAAARQQRERVFAEAAKEGYWVAPAHMSFPGIGHLRREGRSGYRWIPAPYVNDALPARK